MGVQKESYKVLTPNRYGINSSVDSAAKEGYVIFHVTCAENGEITVFMKKILEPEVAQQQDEMRPAWQPDPSRDSYSAFDKDPVHETYRGDAPLDPI